MGYSFGKLDCGLKFGAEHELQNIDDYDEGLFPKEVTEGLALSNVTVNKHLIDKIPTKIGNKKMRITACCIDEDVFDGWDVHHSTKKSWTSSQELYDEMKDKYDWFDGYVLPHKPEPKVKKTMKK